MGAHFVDEANIVVRSGAGGSGCVSFRREKFVARGGPDGGDGGRGGHVYLEANVHMSTLLDLGRQHLYEAQRGQSGMSRNCTGRQGEDLFLQVPVGTIVRDRKTGELLGDLTEVGQRILVAEGGRPGRGNKAFAHATYQTPRVAETGADGEQRELALELRLMADVGLLGLPNAGKSTFLAQVSAAHPKIADYPFTTLAPQLGIAEVGPDRRLVIADIPGLIEGASRGAGLGISFLRHLERTRTLLHLIDSYDRTLEQLVHDFRVIRTELLEYSGELAKRPIINVLNKLDLLPEGEGQRLLAGFATTIGEPVMPMSGATGSGVRAILEAAWRLRTSVMADDSAASQAS